MYEHWVIREYYWVNRKVQLRGANTKVNTLGACLDCLRLALVSDKIVFGADKIVFGGFKTWGQKQVKQGKST